MADIVIKVTWGLKYWSKKRIVVIIRLIAAWVASSIWLYDCRLTAAWVASSIWLMLQCILYMTSEILILKKNDLEKGDITTV